MEATAYSTSPSAAVSAGFTAIDPRAFDEGYSADKLLAHLMKDVLRKKLGGSRAELNQLGTAALTAKASLQNVQKLLGTLDRWVLDTFNFAHGACLVVHGRPKACTLNLAREHGCRAEEELQLLNKEVSKKVAQLQLTVSKQESSYKVGCPVTFAASAETIRSAPHNVCAGCALYMPGCAAQPAVHVSINSQAGSHAFRK